jgi:hypothetical protein
MTLSTSRLLKNRRIELAMGCSEDLSGWLAGLRGVGLDESEVGERSGNRMPGFLPI